MQTTGIEMVVCANQVFGDEGTRQFTCYHFRPSVDSSRRGFVCTESVGGKLPIGEATPEKSECGCNVKMPGEC